MTCIYTLCTWTLKSTLMSSSHPITSWKWFGHQETCKIRSSSSSSSSPPPPPSSSSSSSSSAATSSCFLIHADWNHYNHHHHHRHYHHCCHDLCHLHPHHYHANNTEVGQKKQQLMKWCNLLIGIKPVKQKDGPNMSQQPKRSHHRQEHSPFFNDVPNSDTRKFRGVSWRQLFEIETKPVWQEEYKEQIHQRNNRQLWISRTLFLGGEWRAFNCVVGQVMWCGRKSTRTMEYPWISNFW